MLFGILLGDLWYEGVEEVPMPDAENEEPFPFSTMNDVSRRPDDPTDHDELDDLNERLYWREIILEEVRLGKASRGDAEAKARNRGEAYFCGPKKRFDTFDATMHLWTPEMALSWIKSRTASSVYRHNYPSYRDTVVWADSGMRYSAKLEASYLKFLLPKDAGPTRKGYELVQLKEPEYPVAYVDFDGSLTFFLDLDDVFPQLRQHLLDGVITALGAPPSPHTPGMNIPIHSWLDGSLHASPNEGWVLTTGRGRFTNVHFRAEGFLLAYPPEKQVEWRVTEIRPWRTSMPKMEDYKHLIVRRLQAAHPEGLPMIRPMNARDWHLRTVLGQENTARWFKDIDETDSARAQLAEDAFRRAMTRLLEQALAPAPVAP